MSMKDAKVAVVGSRNFKNFEAVSAVLDRYHDKYGISFLISGGSAGVDSLAERWAKENQIFGFTVYNAQWSKYGKCAGPRRNLLIAESCDVMIAFPASNSKGTYNSIRLAEKLGKKVYIFKITP
jgi:predicted Rossmann fold nucleotide-binding protein DprA/Smf involved in DNA uptake